MNLGDSCNIDYDGTHLGYQERILIATESINCCETGVLIPVGQPYAMCMLATMMPDPLDLDYIAAEVNRIVQIMPTAVKENAYVQRGHELVFEGFRIAIVPEKGIWLSDLRNNSCERWRCSNGETIRFLVGSWWSRLGDDVLRRELDG